MVICESWLWVKFPDESSPLVCRSGLARAPPDPRHPTNVSCLIWPQARILASHWLRDTLNVRREARLSPLSLISVQFHNVSLYLMLTIVVPE